jgi:signal transduction histidine kinase
MVSDRGPGVPPDALENLFKPFFRITAKQDRPGGGAGVGLAIAYHAVNLHHGTVRALNRPNRGLSVEIRLPVRWEKGGASPRNERPGVEFGLWFESDADDANFIR